MSAEEIASRCANLGVDDIWTAAIAVRGTRNMHCVTNVENAIHGVQNHTAVNSVNSIGDSSSTVVLPAQTFYSKRCVRKPPRYASFDT